jgi:hypothetical protein
MISLAKERASMVVPNAPSGGQDALKPKNTKSVDESMEEQFKMLGSLDDAHSKSDVPIAENVKKRKKGKPSRGGPRPRSPLRPGVYVGHDARQRALGAAGGLKTPMVVLSADGIGMRAGEGGGAKGQKKRTNDQGELPSSTRAVALTWGDMMDELDDERHQEESKQYNIWRKRVIECARNMQLEVSRFKLDEK